MKRIVCILLAMTMLFAFAACGSKEEAPEAAPEAEAAPEVEAVAEAEEAPAEVSFPEMKLKTSTGYTQTDDYGVYLQDFCNYITDATGGAVTFDIYYGGTLVSEAEAADYCSQGQLDFVLNTPSFIIDRMPLAFTVASPDGQQEVMDGLYRLLYDNPETAQIINDGTAEMNLKIIGYSAAGSTYLFSNEDVSSFEAAAAQGLSIGTPINQDSYAAMGLGTVTVEPPEFYESLSRGVCDMIGSAATVFYNSSIGEVAKNATNTNTWSAGANLYFNLDVWNGFSPELQQICIDAAKHMTDLSIETVLGQCDSLSEDVAAIGGEYNELSPEESKSLCEMNNSNVSKVLVMFAENLGQSDQMATLIDAWSTEFGLTITY